MLSPMTTTGTGSIKNTGKNEMTILIDEFNTKIRADNTGYNKVNGTQGLSYMNENGERFS